MEINLYNKKLEGVLDIEQYCKDNNIDAKKVTFLGCSYNKLTEIKGLDKLVNLERLYFFFNKLTEIKGLDKLVNLESLDCQNNKLTELNVNNLVNLKWLDCSDNELTEIKGLEKLANLKWLDCDDNEATELKGLDKLVNLYRLNGEEYIKPEPDKFINLILSKIKKLEQVILDNKG